MGWHRDRDTQLRAAFTCLLFLSGHPGASFHHGVAGGASSRTAADGVKGLVAEQTFRQAGYRPAGSNRHRYDLGTIPPHLALGFR